MNEIQTAIISSSPPTEIEISKLVQDLSSAATTLQTYVEHQETLDGESLHYIPSVIIKAQDALIKAEVWLQHSETKLKEAQLIYQSVNELQTMLDVLPVGILVAHDPKNQRMSINRTGLKILNLSPTINPSKSAPGGDQLPFKFMRDGKEIPADELPMQYAATHKVSLQDVELDVVRTDGKVINLIEYASPLYDEHGNVRGSLGVLLDITARKSVEQRLVMQYYIARVLAESNTINKAAAQVLQKICETARWDYGALWRVEPNEQTLINEGVWYKPEGDLSGLAEATRYSILNGDNASLPGQVLLSGQPLYISSLRDFYTADAIEDVKAGLNSAFILPVRSGEKVIAILECLSGRVQPQDPNLLEMLNAVGNQIGVFLERKQLEEALATRANQQQLLAQAGVALASSMNYKDRLNAIVHTVVPDLADWCAIDLVDQDNVIERVAVAHVDPIKEPLLYALQPRRRADLSLENRPQLRILFTGQSLLYTELPSTLLDEVINDPEQRELARQLDPKSSIIVPLIAHGRILGVCTLVQSDSGRRYLPSDLAMAEDIIHRVALSLDNALLYAESQKLNAELERRVDDRTAQLKMAINQLTNQIAERQHAEDQIRVLNAELEQRIIERTAELEIANKNLHKKILDHQKTSRTLRSLLKRTQELYNISQSIGTVRTPDEVLRVLLSSSYLKDASRASIAILDKPWIENEPPPERCFILAEWNRVPEQPRFLNRRFTLAEYGIVLPIPYGEPIVVRDIQSIKELNTRIRNRFADLQTHSLITLPLVAGGEWYGLLQLHFRSRKISNLEDLRHIRGLVDETAIAIKNIRLFESESQARQEAEASNKLKLKFLAMISHELRTPLTSIKGFATTLLADDVVWDADTQRDFLQTINVESDKLSDLIEQLLDLSRMEAGILRISPKKHSLNDIINSAHAQLQAITKDHELILNMPTDLPPIHGDSLRIAQVLTNLVNNATKYSPANTTITISGAQEHDMIQVNVADQGRGIPPQERTRVFEAFRQLEDKAGNQTRGAGLGLAICKGLIEAQGGKIWIQEHHGPGTIVSFTLPIYADLPQMDSRSNS